MPSAVRERIYWHDRIRDEVASFCCAMGLQSVKKEQLVVPAIRPEGDIYLLRSISIEEAIREHS